MKLSIPYCTECVSITIIDAFSAPRFSKEELELSYEMFCVGKSISVENLELDKIKNKLSSNSCKKLISLYPEVEMFCKKCSFTEGIDVTKRYDTEILLLSHAYYCRLNKKKIPNSITEDIFQYTLINNPSIEILINRIIYKLIRDNEYKNIDEVLNSLYSKEKQISQQVKRIIEEVKKERAVINVAQTINKLSNTNKNKKNISKYTSVKSQMTLDDLINSFNNNNNKQSQKKENKIINTPQPPTIQPVVEPTHENFTPMFNNSQSVPPEISIYKESIPTGLFENHSEHKTSHIPLETKEINNHKSKIKEDRRVDFDSNYNELLMDCIAYKNVYIASENSYLEFSLKYTNEINKKYNIQVNQNSIIFLNKIFSNKNIKKIVNDITKISALYRPKAIDSVKDISLLVKCNNDEYINVYRNKTNTMTLDEYSTFSKINTLHLIKTCLLSKQSNVQFNSLDPSLNKDKILLTMHENNIFSRFKVLYSGQTKSSLLFLMESKNNKVLLDIILILLREENRKISKTRIEVIYDEDSLFNR